MSIHEDPTRIEILGQTAYNYGFLANGTSEITLVRALDVSWARTIALSIRAHCVNIGSGAKFEFVLYGTNPSESDGTDYITGVLGTSEAINNSTSAGALLSLSTGQVLTDAMHPFLRVILKATGPSGGPVNLYAELSATISLGGP